MSLWSRKLLSKFRALSKWLAVPCETRVWKNSNIRWHDQSSSTSKIWLKPMQTLSVILTETWTSKRKTSRWTKKRRLSSWSPGLNSMVVIQGKMECRTIWTCLSPKCLSWSKMRGHRLSCKCSSSRKVAILLKHVSISISQNSKIWTSTPNQTLPISSWNLRRGINSRRKGRSKKPRPLKKIWI